MNSHPNTGVSAHNSRLDRLQSFLREDPSNIALRTEIFDLSLQAEQFDCAEEQLAFARQAGIDADSWTMRESNLRIAQRRYDEAEKLLHRLQKNIGPHPAVAFNLGFIASLRGDHAACSSLIMEWADVDAATPLDPDLQSLWLRCLHQLGQLDLAFAWAQGRLSQASLHSEALGIASLIALDLAELVTARDWAEQSLKDNPALTEALMTRGSIALGERDSAQAMRDMQKILRLHPRDGRAWSGLGFAQMLALDLDGARRSLEQAVSSMPGHLGTWHGLGWTCLLQKDYPSAQRAFEAALERDRNFGETHGGLAVIAVLQGQRQLAEEHLRRATGLDSAGLCAQYARALLDGTLRDEPSIDAFVRQLMQGRAMPPRQ